MATTSFHELLGRRLLATGAALTVTAGLVGGAMLMGSGANADGSTTDTQTSVSTDTKTVDPGVAKFRADLKAARALTGQARIDAIKKIRDDAKAGVYGDKVEKRVDNHRFARIWANAPAALKADLKDVRKAAPEDRPALRHDIFEKALDGTYGDKAQKRAEKLKDFVDGK